MPHRPRSGRTSRPVPYRALGLLVATLALSACSMFEKSTPKECPVALTLRETSTVTQFRDGPGRDLVDVAWLGGIRDVRSGCRYLEQQLTVDVAIEMVATRGPAGRGVASANLPFFVAVTRSSDNAVIAKKVFDSQIDVPDGRRRAGVLEEVRQVIQLAPGEEGGAYEIVVGFQLTPEQLTFNRQSR